MMNRNHNLEAVSGELSKAQIGAEQEAVVDALVQMGITSVCIEAFEGWARIPTTHLRGIMRTGLPSDIARRYEDRDPPTDSTVLVEEKNLEYEFCHHNELHIHAEEERFLQPFLSRWNLLGYQIRRRRGEEWETSI